MMRRRSSAFQDGSFRDRYRMRPSIARMTLDLDYGEMDMDGTRNQTPTRSTEALQHRLAELLVFEIRQDGDTQFKSLSVRGLYKYVLKAIKISAEKRRAIRGGQDPMSNYSEYIYQSRMREGKSKRHSRTGTAEDVAKNDDSTSHGDDDEQINNTQTRISNSRDSASGQTLVQEKTVSFSGVTEKSTKIPGVSVAVQHELNNSRSHFEDAQKGDHGPVTYRERLGGWLHPRDMRRLVTPFSASNEPEVIVRRHVILLNFDPLRAVILRDRLLVLVPDGADSLLVDLEKRVRGGAREIERSVFGETTNSNTELSNVESSNIGDSQHSSNVDLSERPAKKRTSPATAILQKVKFPLHNDKQNSSSAATSFGTSDNDSTIETSAFDDNTEFQEWEEMESRGWVDLPFELQSLDAVLGSVTGILGKDSTELQTNSLRAMDELLDQGSGGEEVLRHMKNSIKEMTQRVKGFIRAMNLVLDESEDMALMNLSRILTHPERFIQPVPEEILNEESDEPELILEAHLQHAFSLTNSLDLVRGEIETTQELINQRLDAVRNRLLLANMIISIGSLCVAVGSFIGSIFGMNVINSLEEDPNAFRQIVLGTCLGMLSMVLLFGIVLWYAGTLPNLWTS